MCAGTGSKLIYKVSIQAAKNKLKFIKFEVVVARINLADEYLFGNDASEDEIKEIFDSYALKDERVAYFSEPTRKVAIARAYKGEGKSAVLRLIDRKSSGEIVCSLKASSISPQVTSSDTDIWVREWKKAIVDLVGAELGKRIGFAWNGNSINLVELAEKSGFKSKNIVGAVMERVDEFFGIKLKGGDLPTDNKNAVLSQLNGKPIWVIIDDVDQNFTNTPENKAKVASLLVAAREITNSIEDIRLRLTIRPNIWSIIKPEFEALSNVEQYMYDLRTDVNRMKRMLSKRVEGYLKRNKMPLPSGGDAEGKYEDQLIAMVFDEQMSWGGEKRPPHIILHTLCRHRPRWLIQLCKLAAKKAVSNGHEKIMLSDISDCLYDFGDARITDVVAEFRSQCPQVGDLIACFSRQKEEWKTDELLTFVSERILQNISPVISGVLSQPNASDVAAFLFEIGFLSARKNLEDGQYQHYAFADRPGLLRSKAEMDRGIFWEIHPVYRQRLEMRDLEGRAYLQDRKKKVYVRR